MITGRSNHAKRIEMLEMPIIRIELERMSETISHMFNDHQDEIKGYIKERLTNTINEDWVRSAIDQQLNLAVTKAVERISENYDLQRVIETSIVTELARLIESAKEGVKHV